MVAQPPILPQAELETFCQRWRIVRLDVFGSILRPDFGPGSDVDFLATFDEASSWSLLDRVRMKLELEAVLHRPVDLLNRRAVMKRSPDRRNQHILKTARTIYERA